MDKSGGFLPKRPAIQKDIPLAAILRQVRADFLEDHLLSTAA
jgi:hypothetical protein